MRRTRGFSLLEMLLVLFVVVVITSLASLNVGSGSGGREVERQVRLLRDLAEYAMDEAQFSGRDFGLLLQRDAGQEGVEQTWLRWRERLPQGWRPVERSRDVFLDLAVPEITDLELLLDGSRVLIEEVREAEARSGVEPQWLMTASGETQSGELLWRDADDGRLLWRLQWDALGRFELFSGESEEALSVAPL